MAVVIVGHDKDHRSIRGLLHRDAFEVFNRQRLLQFKQFFPGELGAGPKTAGFDARQPADKMPKGT